MINTTALEFHEEKDRKRGLLIAFFMHIGIIAIALLPFLSNLQPEEPDIAQLVVIDFTDFRPASKEGAQPKQAKSKTEKKKAEKAVPKAKPVPKPKPAPKAQPKDVMTSPEPEIPVNTSPETKPSPPEAPLEKPVPEDTTPEAPTDTDAEADASDNPDASSASSSNNSNNSGAGEGKGDKSNGKADEGINWGEVTGEGLFSRRVTYRADVRKITEEEGKIVVRLCVNRAGNVIFAQNDDATTIEDNAIVRKAIQLTTRYRFEKDYTAPEKQCGKLTYIFEIEKE